jgi:long-chain fatty acid transport protein
MTARTALAIAGVILTTFLAAAAHAQRPAHTGNLATADSAATVYANPAGMSLLDRPSLLVRNTVAYTRSRFKVSEGPTTQTGGDADRNENIVLVPSIYYASPAWHERLRLGFSLNVPSGIGSDYGDDWAGRYIATESSLVYIAINGAASVRLTRWLSLVPETLPDGRVEYEADGFGVGGVVSTLVEIDQIFDFEARLGRPMPFRFGFAYRPETETDIDGVPEIKNPGPLLGAALLANGLFGRNVELGTTSPQRVSAGFHIEPIERFSISVDFAWIDMEEFGSVDVSVSDISTTVKADYQDTFMAGIGLGWALSDRLDLLAGFGYLSPPISDSNRSLSLPFDRIWVVGIGAKVRPRDWFELYGAFNYYDTGDSRVDTEPSPRSGRVVGEFEDHYAIALDLGVSFFF